MKLNKRINENEKLNAYIKNEISSNKNLYMGKGINTKLILKNRKKFINNFMSRNKGLQTEYNEIKSENQKFSYVYKNILNYRDNQAFLEKKFKDNLVLYQKKGYRTPNLTTKSNIIKYSPLIMDGQEHINKFYLQDLYILNRYLKKVWPYDKLEKYINDKNIVFTNSSQDNDDENEKEGINSKYFLNKCDLLVKNAFKEKKEKRIFKSLDISNWFKHDLYADPFLTQGNNIYDDHFFDISNNPYIIKRNKALLLNKEIKSLKSGNTKLKDAISRINSFDDFIKNNSINKRHSVFMMKQNRHENNYSLPLNNINENDIHNNNFKFRNNKKKLTITHKTNIKTKIDDFYKNIINNKKKEKEKKQKNKFLFLDRKDSIKSLKTKLIKHNYKNANLKNYLNKIISNKEKEKNNTNDNNKNNSKSNTNNNINNNKKNKNKLNNINIKINGNKNITKAKSQQIIKKLMKEKKFEPYSGRDPKYLFSLINDIKEPFNKKSILNIYNRTFNISKLSNVNSKYSYLEKYLYQGMVSVDLSS